MNLAAPYAQNLMSVSDPADALRAFESLAMRVLPTGYGQLWVRDSNVHVPTLLLVHEWGAASSVAPEFHRLAAGKGIIGDACWVGTPRLRDMSDPADRAVAAAQDFVERERLGLVAARPLSGDAAAGLLVAARKGNDFLSEEALTVLELLASATLARYTELRRNRCSSLVNNVLEALPKAQADADILRASLIPLWR